MPTNIAHASLAFSGSFKLFLLIFEVENQIAVQPRTKNGTKQVSIDTAFQGFVFPEEQS